MAIEDSKEKPLAIESGEPWLAIEDSKDEILAIENGEEVLAITDGTLEAPVDSGPQALDSGQLNLLDNAAAGLDEKSKDTSINDLGTSKDFKA